MFSSIDPWRLVVGLTIFVVLFVPSIIYAMFYIGKQNRIHDAGLKTSYDVLRGEVERLQQANTTTQHELQEQRKNFDEAREVLFKYEKTYEELRVLYVNRVTAFEELRLLYEKHRSRIPKDQFFTIDQGTYPGHVYVGLAISREDFIAKLQQQFDGSLTTEELKPLHRTVGGIAFSLRGNSVLWVAPTVDPLSYQSVLAHEIFHTVEILFHHVEVRYEPFSEPFAYQIQHLTKEIYQRTA